jgi:hypothetical protein
MFGAGEKFMKRKLLYALGSLYVCLINYDLWGRNSCAEFTQSALSPLSFLPLTKGPHETENSSSSLLLRIPFCWIKYLQQNQVEIGKRVKQRRNFANNIPLESSRRGEHDRVVYF